MRTELKVDTKQVDAMFRRLDSQFSKDIVKALNTTSQKGIQMIQERTAKGRGYRSRFVPYTDDYAEIRSARGRQVARVDLNFSGRMLSSIKRKIDKPSLTARIEFSRAAEAQKASGLNRKRPFFGFNEREQQFLKRFFYKRLTK